jgi:lipopolysaccharide transport system ATP-binding protein
MADFIIKAEGLGKKYIITHQQGGRYTALRDVISDKAKELIKKKEILPSKEDVWALKNVSFEIKQGEAVGIIGRNGAGKSTLLKILSRITDPTTGRVELHGRVASLLEVGTGFHPELTGRENVFLNGAVLGMNRAEIKKKFDEIVDFSGIEKFLDTPVKRYSTGMYMRLAFAIAAHLQPEILLVDEVLAVGDAEFQKKCLGKMDEVSKGEGRTVVFVSHQIDAISRLCKRTLVLNNGEIEFDGNTEEGIRTYFNHANSTGPKIKWQEKLPGNDIVQLLEGDIVDEQNFEKNVFDIRRPVGIKMKYKVLQDGLELVPGLNLYNTDGIHILSSHHREMGLKHVKHNKGVYSITAWLPGNFLAEGNFRISLAMMSYDPFIVHFHEEDILTFSIVDTIEGDSARGFYGGMFPGVVRPVLEWSEKIQEPFQKTQ